MTEQNQEFHKILRQIHQGATEIKGHIDADIMLRLIDFGFATGVYTPVAHELTYTDVKITPAGRSLLEELDESPGDAVR